MEFIIGLATIGSWFFWLLLSVFSGIIIYNDYERNDRSVLTFASFIMVIVFGAHLYHIATIAGIGTVATYVGLYVLCGAVWSVIKWALRIRRLINEREENSGGKALKGDHEFARRLQPAQHRDLITVWIIFWPWSFLVTTCSRLFTSVYDMLTGVYKWVTNMIAGDVLKQIAGADPEK